VSRDERALSAVPRWLWAALAIALASQLAVQSLRAPAARHTATLPPPPRPAALRLAAFGENEALARLVALHVQGYDAGRVEPGRLTGWLQGALALDPRSAYPMFLAARVYAETADAQRARAVLAFIHGEFLRDPNRHWPWLAHAALLAKHRLRDLALARRYASDLQRRVTAPGVPLWATQMEVFILEDLNELEAAKVLLGGLLASGKIGDPAELRFLKQRLEALEAKTRPGKVN
jgi:hypothetical protein